MKTKLVLAAMAVCMTVGVNSMYAQDFSKTPYIEVIGKAEKYVAPDEISLSIVINEKDYAKKQSLEALEKEMLSALKKVGIDTKKDLTVVDMSSDFNSRKWRKGDIKLSKAYKLRTSTAKQTMQVLLALDEVGISEVSISQIKCSNIEQYKDEARVMAMKDAKRKAKILTDAIDQPLGKAIYISENDFSNVRNYARPMMLKSAGVTEDALVENEVPDLDFENIKIDCRVNVKFALE
ncbi:MAG: SIMPL domain-containing protein [Paludibacteraceae bacterium]|nr:SIMPL domain-containing protein [Paludibacteraceae bacterium]